VRVCSADFVSAADRTLVRVDVTVCEESAERVDVREDEIVPVLV